MRRIRVLRLIARMNVGGPAQQIVGLQRGLDPRRFDCRLVTGWVRDDEEDHLRLRGADIDVLRIAGLGRSVRLGDDVRALADVVGEMRRFAPDIVHTHTAKAGVLGRVAALRAGVPATVHTYHGHLLHGYFSPPVTAGVTLVERTLARRTDRLLAVGERVRDDLLDAGIGRPEQYRVIPPGVDLPDPPAQHEARIALGLPPEGLVVAFVARLTQVKQPLRFIEVARLVAERRADVRFLVAGDGPLAAETRAAAEGLPIDFLGWRPDVHYVYAASDVVLLTSDNEGMPVSLIEGGLCGRAAVTTDVGSAREVTLDGITGRVVPDRDAGSLARALLKLVEDRKLLAEMGARARDRCHARFGMDRLIRDMGALYEELAGGES
jgi:glycosyltransferase involved in cell wall biosynthesis